MTFAYQAGSATPDYSGLFEIPGLRICNVPDADGNEPTFRPLNIPPVNGTCPIRYNVQPIPRGGAKMSEPLFDSWQFDVVGDFWLDKVDDVQAAIDYLCDAVTVAAGAIGAQVNAPGWAEARTMTVRKGGPVVVTVPDKGDMAAPAREFTLTFVAEDPLKYASTPTVVPITASVVTNEGNAQVPYLVRFDGPNTGHVQIDGPVDDGTVLLDYALGSGEFIQINTRDGSYVTNTGVDMNPYIAIGSDVRLLVPGGNGFTFSSGSGGSATVTAYSGWE